MTTFVNVGAQDLDGDRIKTKKALKLAVADGGVRFDRTDAFAGHGSKWIFLAEDTVDSDVVLSVVGPDPYTSRKWYATIKNGKVS